MDKFYENIEKICEDNEKVAMFIDMDGTIIVYGIGRASCRERV